MSQGGVHNQSLTQFLSHESPRSIFSYELGLETKEIDNQQNFDL